MNPSLSEALGARGLRLPLDTTRKVAPRSASVIYEHDFSDAIGRHDGWTHLFTPGETSNCGSTQWLNRGGQGRLAVIANNQAGGLAMGIRRLGTYFGEGRHLVEFVVSIEFLNLNQAYPRYFGIGLDACTEAGFRNFFQLRYLNYDEAAGAIARRWQIDMGGTMVELPRAVPRVWDNENKALPVRVILDVDVSTGRYHGVQIGGVKMGSLADTPDTTIFDLGARTSENLVSFASGANLCASVANRTTGTKTMGQINVHFARLTALN